MNFLLEVSDLSFFFEQKNSILQNLSFSVEEGESVGILGSNGAGKSTLLWCILGLLKSNGLVNLFGKKIDKNSLKQVSMVFQNPEDQLFMPCLLDDLELSLRNRHISKEDARKAALDVLRQVGLSEMACHPAHHLSLGERKRAAIAAALVTNPKLLILDEPTAELDGKSLRQLGQLLNNLKNTTKLITSHHLEFINSTCQRVIVLSKAKIIADGLTAEILANKSILEQAGLI